MLRFFMKLSKVFNTVDLDILIRKLQQNAVETNNMHYFKTHL